MRGDLAAALAALREEYAAELPRLVRELGALIEAASPRARSAAHRLRGTAGSYGFTAVGAAAGRVEDALEEGESGLAELAELRLALQPAGAETAKSSGSSK